VIQDLFQGRRRPLHNFPTLSASVVLRRGRLSATRAYIQAPRGVKWPFTAGFESLPRFRRIPMVNTMKAFEVSLAFPLVLVASPSQAWGDGGFHGGFHSQGFGHGYGFRGFGSDGFGGPRVMIGLGPGLWWGPTYAWPWYCPPPHSGYAASSVVQPSTEYVEPGPPAPPSQSYWDCCQSARAYYTDVQSYREQGVRVPPTPEIGRTGSELADQAMPSR